MSEVTLLSIKGLAFVARPFVKDQRIYLNIQGIEEVDALEVGGAVLAKRLYTQGLSATDLSQHTLSGDVNVTGSIGASEVKTDKISSKHIDVTNALYCSTDYAGHQSYM